MTLPVEKETYIDSDDKTFRALTYDLFQTIHDRLCEIRDCHTDHMKVCNVRFDKIEKEKKKDTAKASASGFLGGFVAVVANYIRQWLS